MSESCRTSALERITRGSHITYYSLMFFIAYAFKGQVHVFAGRVNIVMSLILQDKCNIEIFLCQKTKEMQWLSAPLQIKGLLV